MIDTDGWPFEGERPADWDRAGEISRVAMLLARQQALMQLCRQRRDAVDRRKVTLRAELTESLIRMSGQLTVMRAVAERPDPDRGQGGCRAAGPVHAEHPDVSMIGPPVATAAGRQGPGRHLTHSGQGASPSATRLVTHRTDVAGTGRRR